MFKCYDSWPLENYDYNENILGKIILLWNYKYYYVSVVIQYEFDEYIIYIYFEDFII